MAYMWKNHFSAEKNTSHDSISFKIIIIIKIDFVLICCECIYSWLLCEVYQLILKLENIPPSNLFVFLSIYRGCCVICCKNMHCSLIWWWAFPGFFLHNTYAIILTMSITESSAHQSRLTRQIFCTQIGVIRRTFVEK